MATSTQITTTSSATALSRMPTQSGRSGSAGGSAAAGVARRLRVRRGCRRRCGARLVQAQQHRADQRGQRQRGDHVRGDHRREAGFHHRVDLGRHPDQHRDQRREPGEAAPGAGPWRRGSAAAATRAAALDSSARPRPTTKAMKMMDCTTAWASLRALRSPARRASSSVGVDALRRQPDQQHVGARRSRSPAASAAAARRAARARRAGPARARRPSCPAARSAARRSRCASTARDMRRLPRDARCRPCSSSPSRASRATSAGQASAMSRQNSRPSGRVARARCSWASNSARRLASSSLPRCCASTVTRRASRMSASSALRSFGQRGALAGDVGVLGRGAGGRRVAQFAQARVEVVELAGARGDELVGLASPMALSRRDAARAPRRCSSTDVGNLVELGAQLGHRGFGRGAVAVLCAKARAAQARQPAAGPRDGGSSSWPHHRRRVTLPAPARRSGGRAEPVDAVGDDAVGAERRSAARAAHSSLTV